MIRPFLEQRTAFGGQYVINYLSTAGGLKGPRRNAKYINAKFMDYPLKKGVYYGTTYVDFPSREQVLILNKRTQKRTTIQGRALFHFMFSFISP